MSSYADTSVVPYNQEAAVPSPTGSKWSSRFPVYQIDFQAHASGKRVASTKRRVRWRFGFPNKEALDAGETGTACRGEEHDVTIVWSITSGKRLLLADGHEVHYSTNRAGVFEYSWTMRGNHVLKVVAHAAPPLTATPGFRQYDFMVDGQSFFSMPKVYELGIKGPVGGDVRLPGVPAPGQRRGSAPGSVQQHGYRNYDLRSGQYVDVHAPRTREEEEEDLQRAIKASLEESRNHVERHHSSSSIPALPASSSVISGNSFDTPIPVSAPAPTPAPAPAPVSVHPPVAHPPVAAPFQVPTPVSLQSGTAAPPSDSNLLDLLSEPSADHGPVPSSYSFDPSSQSYGNYDASGSQSTFGQPYVTTAPSFATAPAAQPYVAPPVSEPAPPQGQSYNTASGVSQQQAPYSSFDPSMPPTFSQIKSTTQPQYDSYSAPPAAPPQPGYSDANQFQAPQPNYAPDAQQGVVDYQASFEHPGDAAQGQNNNPSVISSVTDQDSPGKLSMSTPFGTEEKTAEHEEESGSKSEVDKAMKNLVNIDDLTAPPEEQMTKLTLNPFADEPKKKSNDKKSRGIDPPAAGYFGVQPTLEEMRSVRPSSKPVEAMKAPPSSFHPDAPQAGALVLHGTQQGNFGGYGQGPPPIQKATGFGVGAQIGAGYDGQSAQQQYQQPPTPAPSLYQQKSQYQQQPPQTQQGYGQAQYNQYAPQY